VRPRARDVQNPAAPRSTNSPFGRLRPSGGEFPQPALVHGAEHGALDDAGILIKRKRQPATAARIIALTQRMQLPSTLATAAGVAVLLSGAIVTTTIEIGRTITIQRERFDSFRRDRFGDIRGEL
jgi:hypothetical protein